MPTPLEITATPAELTAGLTLGRAAELKSDPEEKNGVAPAGGTDGVAFRADLLAHFRTARDKAISNLARPEG